jgi:hypothetical protein
MPCIFCIAVFAMLATAVTTAVLDQLEDRLASEAAGPLRRSDSGSVARYEFEFPVPPPPGGPWARAGPTTAPVVLTVYKRYGRARIQVLTHQLQRAQAQALQQHVAALAGLQVIEWSNPQTEQKVRDAVDAVDAEAAAQPATPDPLQPRPWRR